MRTGAFDKALSHVVDEHLKKVSEIIKEAMEKGIPMSGQDVLRLLSEPIEAIHSVKKERLFP